MKIVVNSAYGGFGLSFKAIQKYFELRNWKLIIANYDDNLQQYIPVTDNSSSNYICYFKNEINNDNYWSVYDLDRTDPFLIQLFNELTYDEINDNDSRLRIIDIPDNVDWYIDDYDGIETIREKHRSW